MSYIEEYYNNYLTNCARDVCKQSCGAKLTKVRDTLRNDPSYAFVPTKDVFVFLETSLRKEFDEKLKKQQDEIDTLKQALADTLAALAQK